MRIINKVARQTGYCLFQNLVFLSLLFIGAGGLDAVYDATQPEPELKPKTYGTWILTDINDEKNKHHNRNN